MNLADSTYKGKEFIGWVLGGSQDHWEGERVGPCWSDGGWDAAKTPANSCHETWEVRTLLQPFLVNMGHFHLRLHHRELTPGHLAVSLPSCYYHPDLLPLLQPPVIRINPLLPCCQAQAGCESDGWGLDHEPAS